MEGSWGLIRMSTPLIFFSQKVIASCCFLIVEQTRLDSILKVSFYIILNYPFLPVDLPW